MPGTEAGLPSSSATHLEFERELGRESDPVQFGGISQGGGFLADSILVVGDWRTRTVRVFDLGTGASAVIAGPGQGPGEFENLTRVGVRSPSEVWVADVEFGRLSLFEGGGPEWRTVLTWQLRDYHLAPPVGPAGPAALLPDGTVLVHPLRVERPEPGTWRARNQPLLRLNGDGQVVDTLLAPPPAHFPGIVVRRGSEAFSMVPNLQAEHPLIAVSPSGDRVVFLHRTAGVDEATMGWVHQVAWNGSSFDRTEVALHGPSLPGNRQELIARVEGILPEGVEWPGGRDAFVTAVMDEMQLLEWISPVVSLSLDGAGAAWLGLGGNGQEGAGSERTWWTGFLADGEWFEARFDRPVWRVIDRRGDRVAAVLRDSLGVETVGLFGIADRPE